ncbi:probable RNA-dependent RNA polymerase 5 isoform X2 [Cornus florida]|uniref:probable RNA-dependent RNA polymerase 5 isoform X2 n=1 Tax=Cornus florida TaxID=4283 RepID=UPI00289A526D|nr:probable RNA-dependent RNA polymerase 5 isoform X2 [Cornus florida]
MADLRNCRCGFSVAREVEIICEADFSHIDRVCSGAGSSTNVQRESPGVVAAGSIKVTLPPSVEELLHTICVKHSQPPPDMPVRKELCSLGEKAALDLLRTISGSKEIRTLNGFIIFMVRKHRNGSSQESDCSSPQKQSSPSPSTSNHHYDYSPHSPIPKDLTSPSSRLNRANMQQISDQLLALGELEFRKAFLILSYIGRNRLENVMSANDILRLKDMPMGPLESRVWTDYGRKNCEYLDWDSKKTYLYHCHVDPDGSYSFKGPYLKPTRTHLQRELGDDNVLLVKFAEESQNCTKFAIDSPNYSARFNKIGEDGIFVGLRRYRFFVFKDGGKEEKKKNPTSSTVKCYFVRMESIAPCDEGKPYVLSNKTVDEARCLFMHAHMVSSMAKYMARFSLILSKTIKLQVNLSSVHIERIEDIPCRDENGHVVCNEDGERLIHTDGTGYISEDLALMCPKDFYKAEYINYENFERFLECVNSGNRSLELRGEARSREPPLLTQVRLFNNGCAVKGTLLVNRKLPPRTIQIRPSMVKVETDSRLKTLQNLNSLEIVGVSHQPRKTFLSRNLIALLSYGGVPKEYFLDILMNALEDSQSVYSNKRAALRVAVNHGEIDDDYTTSKMILSGIPLNEPCLNYRLSILAKNERKALKGGKLPVSESFYLMGTVDPTGVLKRDEVCVILDNGQITHKVLVYRNPGLHFGDIHVLNAVHVKALEEVVGNAKYAIFFSSKGERSIANEMANGDFDGDMYWVSLNPQLLNSFKASTCWTRIHSTPSASTKKPSDYSAEELERELFQLFLSTRFQRSYNMSVAADSWLSFMDQLLISGEASADEKDCMPKDMLKLIDIYYDALDAPKSGKKVEVPKKLRAKKYPHYMEKKDSYQSTSVLGILFDTVNTYLQIEDPLLKEVTKLPCFDVEIPEACLKKWKERYNDYRIDMTKALQSGHESKNDCANQVIKKYKQMLYGADEFEESERKVEEIYNDALAIYHVTYDHAITQRAVKYCNFAWKVAGTVLCRFYAHKLDEKSILCSPSVLKEVLN